MSHPTTHPDSDGSERCVAWAVMLLAASLLAFELVATRLFSVILWNHFAFLAISVALFGIGVAGVSVYVLPRFFTPERAYEQLRLCTLILPAVIWLVVAVLCALPIRMDFGGAMFQYLGIIFLVTALPFAVGGVGITLALSHWPRSVNRIYAFDLIGSASGCLLVIALLGALDGPTAALAIAALPVAAALVLRRSTLAVAMAAVLLIGIGINQSQGLVRIRISKSRPQNPIFEAWNAFSRVTVQKSRWRGWWVSDDSKHRPVETLGIRIDGDAFTPMMRFDGDLSKVSIVLDDITALAYNFHPDAKDALVIGSGGGKDVLSALASGAQRVRAVEINPIIANTIVSDRFRDFVGDLYRHPRVELVVSEGRTALRRDTGEYDVLQLSMVDTSAASAAGAYALTENSLYTVDAAQEFLAHLRPEGVFTCTWANLPSLEGVNRLVSIYVEALRRSGETRVVDKIAVVASGPSRPLGTVLLRPAGFSAADSKRLLEIARRLDFVPIYVPGHEIAVTAEHPEIAVIRELLTSDDLGAFYDSYHLDLRPVDDDRPFFFYQNRARDAWRALGSWSSGTFYGNGLFIITKLLIISGAAVAAFMFLPLLLAGNTAVRDFRGAGFFLIYFLCLGVGFIVLEIALVQMFGYYLGHPLLGLGVSLTSMLLCTGIGSALGGRWRRAEIAPRLSRALVGVVLIVLVYYFLLPPLARATVGWNVVLRSGVVMLVIAPLGLLLGLPFPSGLRLLGESSRLTPWMWSINGGASVFGASLATMMVMHLGFSTTLLVGAVPYGVALLALRLQGSSTSTA